MSAETILTHQELGLPNNVPKDATTEEYEAFAQHCVDRVKEIKDMGPVSEHVERLIKYYDREEKAARQLAAIAL